MRVLFHRSFPKQKDARKSETEYRYPVHIFSIPFCLYAFINVIWRIGIHVRGFHISCNMEARRRSQVFDPSVSFHLTFLSPFLRSAVVCTVAFFSSHVVCFLSKLSPRPVIISSRILYSVTLHIHIIFPLHCCPPPHSSISLHAATLLSHCIAIDPSY